MLNSTILVPAYGKTYASIDTAMQDWNNGVDFKVMGHSCYTSIRDLADLQSQLCTVYIHLTNLRASIIVSTH